MSYEDDEAYERFLEAMEYAAKRHETDVLAAAEHSLAQVDTGECPPPLTWHPFYRGKTWLIDWLNGKDTGLPQDHILIPLPQRSVVAQWTTDDLFPTAEVAFNALRMSKWRAWGPAPYVGHPFHYEWNVGTDNLSRSIAGESRIVYH